MNRNSLRAKVQVKLTTAALAGAMLVSGSSLSTHAAAPVAPTGVESNLNYSGNAGLTSGIAFHLEKYLEKINVPDIVKNDAPVVASVEVASLDTPVSVELTDSSVATEEVAVEEQAEVAPEEASKFTNMGVANVEEFANIRSAADTNSDIVGKLYSESGATVLETVQDAEGADWHHIQSGNVDGFIKSDYLTTGDEELAKSIVSEVATASTDGLNVRTDASTDAGVATQLSSGQQVQVVDASQEGWVKVSVDGQEGFVSSEFVTTDTSYKTAESKEEEQERLAQEAAKKEAEEAARRASQSRSNATASTGVASTSVAVETQSAPVSGNGSAVVGYASQFVGNPYVYGGSSLTGGADCSGFVMSVFAHFGVSLPHSSGALGGVGVGVSQSDMQPGDIVVYSGHVGIYAGGGQIVNALNSRTGIRYDNVNFMSIVAVRRVL